MDKKTAVIIGAGPAGITAAYKLLKETDIHPVILEETDFAGGISRTAEYCGNRIDIGGHRFFSKNEEVMKLWNELMPLQGKPSKDDILLNNIKSLSADGPDPEKEDRVMLLRTRISRIYYLGKFFDYPISIKPQTFINMGFIRTLKAAFGYLASIIHKRKEKSLEDFYINRFGKPLYKMFFENYTQKVWGINPSKIAPDWGAQRVKGLSLWKAFISIFIKGKKRETSLIEEFYYPKYGPGQLWECLLDDVKKLGGEVRYNSKVVSLNFSGDKVNSVETINTKINCDYVISTMPVKDLINALSTVPQNIKKIAEDLPYRDFITVGLSVKKLKIINSTKIKTVSDIVPDCWIYIQEPEVKIGRLQIFNNWSPYLVKDHENTVWIGLEYFCNEGDKMWNMPEEEFINFAINELCKISIIDKENVLESTCIKVKKAYPAYFGSYKDFPQIRKFLDPIENLFCIGRNGQHRYNNMDHSMLTAITCVNNIKNGMKSKDNIWNVNTEEEYHESKK